MLMQQVSMIIFCRKNYTIQKRVSEINGYPKWLFKQKFDSLRTSNKNYKQNNKNKNGTNINNSSDKTVHILKLPYKGDHGIHLLRTIKTSTKKIFLEKHIILQKKQGYFNRVKTNKVILLGTKLSSHFNIKDHTNK